MARCSGRGGMVKAKLGTSRHRRLLNTAPTLMNFPIWSHHSGVRTNQRRKAGSTRFPLALNKTRFCPSANSVPVSSTAVTPGFVRRDRITSLRWCFVLRFQVTKFASEICRAVENSILPLVICGMPTYGRPSRTASGVLWSQSSRMTPASARVSFGHPSLTAPPPPPAAPGSPASRRYASFASAMSTPSRAMIF